MSTSLLKISFCILILSCTSKKINNSEEFIEVKTDTAAVTTDSVTSLVPAAQLYTPSDSISKLTAKKLNSFTPRGWQIEITRSVSMGSNDSLFLVSYLTNISDEEGSSFIKRNLVVYQKQDSLIELKVQSSDILDYYNPDTDDVYDIFLDSTSINIQNEYMRGEF